MIAKTPISLLTIGGSDSGGAAGIQADLKTWTALRCHGMSALTVVTAQNSVHVTDAVWMTADLLTAQITAVLTDYQPRAIKTGMLGRTDLISAIAPHLQNTIAVIDPVLVDQHGGALFDPAVTAAYRTHLFPVATVITPNWQEAALLAERPITDIASLETAAHTLHAHGAAAVLITGFPNGDHMLDLLVDDTGSHHLPHPYITTENTHGSGDTFSAALTAWLAKRTPRHRAILHAQQFTEFALRRAAAWQLGAGHGPVRHF